MNRQQTCSFLGWTRAQFDDALRRGFPARKIDRSRGQDWQIDSREAVEWVVAQEAPKYRPKAAKDKPDFSNAPPGWEAFRAVELVENPLERVAMLNVLMLLYSLPRLAANVAADEGVSIEQTYRISAGVLIAVWTWCGQRLPYWPKDEDAVSLTEAAFELINWPHLAVKAGVLDWKPSAYAAGWGEVEPDSFAECVAHGEAIDRKYEELERADAVRAHA
jgi:hypothetical protein